MHSQYGRASRVNIVEVSTMTRNPTISGRRIVLMNTIRELEGKKRFYASMEQSVMSGLYPLEECARVEQSLAMARQELAELAH